MKKKIKSAKPSTFNQIPNDWEVKTLGEIGTVIRGASPRPQGDSRYYGGEVPRLMVEDVTRDGKYVTPRIDFLTEVGAKKSRPCKAGTLTIVCSGVVGVPSFLAVDACIHDGFLAILDIKKNVIEDYLFYQIFRLKEKLERSATHGGIFTNLTTTILKEFEISIPPLPEQKAIAHFLGLMDIAINQNNQLINQKELRKKWLIQNLLTGKKRLKGYNGAWKKEKLEKYLVKHEEKSIYSNQYPVLTSSRRGIFLQSDYYTRDVASIDNTGYNVVPRGFFTYRHMSDDLIFKFNINNIVDKGIVSTLYPVFTVKNIDSYFLLCKLNEGNEFKIHAQELKQGGSRTYVYFNTLCQLKINLPSLEEQIAIAQVLQAVDKEILLLMNKTEKLKEQKKGLMQILLTGKKRLKVN